MDWDNPEKVIDLTASILYDVNTFVSCPNQPNCQPIGKNQQYARFQGAQKIEDLIDNLCGTDTCPLQMETRGGRRFLYLDSSDIDSFVAQLEVNDDNPVKW